MTKRNPDEQIEENMLWNDWRDFRGESGRSVLLMICDKLIAKEKVDIDIISLAVYIFPLSPGSRPLFGTWVKDSPSTAFVLRKIVWRLRERLSVERAEAMLLRQTLEREMQDHVYSEYSFTALKYKMYTTFRIPEIEQTLKHYVWLMRLAEGKINFKQDDLTELKQVPISKILNGFDDGRGHRQFFRCPIHNEKTGSFCWYKLNNSWYCFSCSTGGDTIDLIQKIHKCSFKEAVAILKKY